MIGQTIEISKSPIRLGRRATNDIIFAQDMPVSREHVVIENTPAGITLTEISSIDSEGEVKRPRYGTYVNEVEVGEEPVVLLSADEIRLGSRVRLKFETYAGRMMAEELLTYDEIMLPESGIEDTRTMEADQATPEGEDEDGTREMPPE
jgi:pSer/pThr/pTyr-binding forkhead associated (FHA) protein